MSNRLRRLIGTNPDNRQAISSARRNSGYAAEQIPFQDFNELFYRSQIDYAWGTQGQTTANEANFYTDANGEPKDKTGSTVTIPNDSRIVMVHNVTATGNIKFNPSSGKRFLIQSEAGIDIDMGNAGGSIPYKLIFGPNVDGCDIFVNTANRFEDIPFSSTDDQKRYIANQGIRNKIRINEDIIYDPSRVGDIVTKMSWPTNPYLVRANGQSLSYRVHQTTPSTNDTLAWFRDLNKYENGYVGGVEVASRHTLPALITASPHLFQVNTPNGMLRDVSTVDPDIHSRTDTNGVSIAATVDFDGSSIVTFQGSVGNAKNYMRITGGAIPGGASATTLIVDIDPVAKTATMIDALTQATVSVGAATGVSATIDNSGASGGSSQDFAIENITGSFEHRAYDLTSAFALIGETGVFSTSTGISRNTVTTADIDGAAQDTKSIDFDASRVVNASTETRPSTTDTFIFQQA